MAPPRPERLSTTKPRKTRLDQLLVERGLVSSRSRAQALLLAGQVRVGPGDAARRDRRPGEQVAADIEIRLEAGPGGHPVDPAPLLTWKR